MSQVINGEAVNFSTKQIMSRKGNNVTIHFVHVNTFDEPLNVGFKQPFKLGDNVTGTAEKAYGEWKLNIGAVPTGNPAPQQTSKGVSSVSSGKFGGNSAPFPVPPLHPENRIMRQNALSHAAAVVAARIGADKQGATKNYSNEAIAADVIEIANELVRWSTGRAELEAMEQLEKTGTDG